MTRDGGGARGLAIAVRLVGGTVFLLALTAFIVDTVRDSAADGPQVMPIDHEAATGSNGGALHVLSGLPLYFTQGFSLDAAPSPLFQALDGAHDLEMIDSTSSEALADARLLLMAHPRAQTAENLVALDDWVRGGGRLLLLADPAFRGAGDLPSNMGPPPFFADTGLLDHWGLALEGPLTEGDAAVAAEAGALLVTAPGRLVATGEACSVHDDGFRAECAIEQGRVTVLADADFAVREDAAGDDNRNALITLLARLGR
ncbi:motility-associated ABC transporter substrate-binding family protein [Sphingomicrobium arenosum]|uniref:hypothetical protein n=1 Tax=Sphingomicrobium arenosum TaxID=2233861 RepID=UPI0022405676|nr:hypothetical protein [Sphingomicrobium arenosum]